MNRRGFLQGILAAGIAPFVVTTAGVLMPVRKIITPQLLFSVSDYFMQSGGFTLNQPVTQYIGVKELLVRSTYDSEDTRRQVRRVLNSVYLGQTA